MRMYLLYPDNTWSDLADYTVTPEPRVEGVWTDGDPDGLSPKVFIPVADKLAAILDSQDLQTRVQFSSLRAAIHLELQLGHLDVVEAIIQQTMVPANLEVLKAQMLTLLQEGV